MRYRYVKHLNILLLKSTQSATEMRDSVTNEAVERIELFTSTSGMLGTVNHFGSKQSV